jgi:hypothetical protein
MIKSTFIIAIFLGYFAQCQEIPNGGFENWEQKSYGEEPTSWGEFSLQFLHSIIPGILDSTIVKSEDAYSGSYAMELRTKKLTGFFSDTIIAMAVLNLKNANMDSAMMKIDSSLESFSGYIKQNLIDSAENSTAILISVYSKGELIGVGSEEFVEDIIEYTRFNIPIMYFDDLKGDSISTMVVAGNSDAPLPGNIMLLDNFKLNYKSLPQAIEEQNLSKIEVYPNPFVDQFSIKLNASETQEYEIYSLMGKVVLRGTIKPNMNSINLASLAPNTYILKTGNQTFRLIKKK